MSKLEKHIIDQMIALDESGGLNVVTNILQYRFNDHAYYIQMAMGVGCAVCIQSSYLTKMNLEVGPVIEAAKKDLFIAMKLLESLDRENLIYTYGTDPTDFIGPKIIKENYAESPMPRELDELLRVFLGKAIIPTQALVDLQKRGYRNEEDVRFGKTLRWTQWGVWSAAVAALVAAIALWLDYTKKPDVDSSLREDAAANRKAMEDIALELKPVAVALDRISTVQPPIRSSLPTSAMPQHPGSSGNPK